jgi:hypothetical protein
MILDNHMNPLNVLEEVRPERFSAPSMPLSRRAGQGNTHRSDDLIVPFFRLMVDDRALANRPSRSASFSGEWCSSPEFCQFTGRSDPDVTPPPAA